MGFSPKRWIWNFGLAWQKWIGSSRRRQARLTNPQKGDSAELLAYRYLRENGYKIIARKYRRRTGEVDLIGWDCNVLAFIEVKYRAHLQHGRPAEAVNQHKRRQICRVAREYRNRHNLHGINYRYDIVSICGNGPEMELQVVKDAFKEVI